MTAKILQNEYRAPMTRYDELLRQAEDLWQKERATKAQVVQV